MTRKAASRATITGPRRWSRAPSTSRPTAASKRRSPSASPGGRSSVRKGKAEWAAALLLACAASAPAQDREMTPREEYEAVRGEPKRAPIIPRELRDIVVESRAERLVVRGLDGQ